MNERSIEILELPKILARLASRTTFSGGRELALALRPGTEFSAMRAQLAITAEARRLLELKPNVGLGGAQDIRPLVSRATIGGRLEPQELLAVLGTLHSGRNLRVNIVRLNDQLPLLADQAAEIEDCPRLESEIARCIDERAEVSTGASPALSHIRMSLRSARERLIGRLTQTLNSEAYRPMIQEPIVTQRDGRYVIPVKAEYKGQFRGIVHDQSGSGATLFIEPLATVELNNRVRELELAEEHEIDRILRELSTGVAAVAADLEGNVIALSLLDLSLAKAKFAGDLQAVAPELVANATPDKGGPPLLLLNARHPLLTGQVVPITVRLGGDFRALVITGPNTGGKTVALKTVGLLTLMAQAGLHIPADDGSRVPVCHGIFADIGDEQSIEQSLSTFSSHMRNVVTILGEAREGVLVLLDELGAGTDPAEGSALAQAILDYLLHHGALVMATTHYSELKAYAHTTPQVENASVEFDVEALKPTYRLSIGLPGRSNALAIASRLGLPALILDNAQSRLHPTEVAVEQMLGEIQTERDRAIEERLLAEQRLSEAERLKAKLARRLADIEQERQALIDRAREEARQEASRKIDAVRARLAETMQAVEAASPDRAGVLAGLRETQRLQRYLAERREQEASVKARPVKPTAPSVTGPLRVGDLVHVTSLNQEGELLSLPGDGEAEVQVGNFKMRVVVSNLRRLGRAAKSNADARAVLDIESRDQVPLEMAFRGWRAEDVPTALDQYIHDAYLAGLTSVRVIHGKGTGVLRRLVREQLSGNPLVRSMHQPEPRDGGEGVTVVQLAN